jgi:hypothetical protein
MTKKAKPKGGAGCGGCLGGIVTLGIIALVIAALAGGSSSSTPSNTVPESTTPTATETTATTEATPPPASSEPTGETDEVGSASHAGDAEFCDEHHCIGDFTTENGTVVECADGTFSHAGGLDGACSDHGGEK